MSDAPYLKAACHSLTMGLKSFLSPELFDLQTFKVVGASGPTEQIKEMHGGEMTSKATMWKNNSDSSSETVTSTSKNLTVALFIFIPSIKS
ncbi:hypothetical protein [Acetobacter sp.]|uniref:hypothetical protein n=1 Tax=Acetobacter sp. TaxID=440 RepID=UPI0039ED20F8